VGSSVGHTERPHDAAVPLLDMHPKEMRTGIEQYVNTHGKLFTKGRSNPMAIDGQNHEMWHTIQWNII
jgi:hypothetical protein